MEAIRTGRFELINATSEILAAETGTRSGLADKLRAVVPESWPPESLADAFPYFRQMLDDDPGLAPWLVWYAIHVYGCERVLCGSVGFKNAPDSDGCIEIGYSIIPEYQGRGHATEIVSGLIGWAQKHPEVRCILAQTAPDNTPSIRVLEKNGFVRRKDHDGAGTIMFERILREQDND